MALRAMPSHHIHCTFNSNCSCSFTFLRMSGIPFKVHKIHFTKWIFSIFGHHIRAHLPISLYFALWNLSTGIEKSSHQIVRASFVFRFIRFVSFARCIFLLRCGIDYQIDVNTKVQCECDIPGCECRTMRQSIFVLYCDCI